MVLHNMEHAPACGHRELSVSVMGWLRGIFCVLQMLAEDVTIANPRDMTLNCEWLAGCALRGSYPWKQRPATGQRSTSETGNYQGWPGTEGKILSSKSVSGEDMCEAPGRFLCIFLIGLLPFLSRPSLHLSLFFFPLSPPYKSIYILKIFIINIVLICYVL